MGFSINSLIISISPKLAKLHYNATGTSKILKTLKKLLIFENLFGFFWKRFFFSEKNRYRYRIRTNMPLKFWKFPKRSNLDFLKKDRWVFRKKRKFLKITKGTKFGVEFNWISKISQNIRKLAFFWKKERLILPNKILRFLKTAKGSKFIVDCDSLSKISQNVHNLVFLKKNFEFFENR